MPKYGRRRSRKSNGADDATNDDPNSWGSNQLTDDQRHALTHSWAEKYAAAVEIKKAAAADVANIQKIAKEEGIPLVELKAYVAAGTEEGRAVLKSDLERIQRVARWRAFPLGTQAELFDADSPETNRSFIAGKESGMAGEPPKPPPNYDINGWMAGWSAGQALLLNRASSQPKTGRQNRSNAYCTRRNRVVR